MSEIKITLNPSDIKSEVDMRTAYIGVEATKADDQHDYRRVAMTSMDLTFFDSAYHEAAANIRTSLRRYSPAIGTDNIALKMPGNYDNNLNGAVQEALTAYYVNYILYKWLSMTLPQVAEGYANTAQSELLSARTMLASRLAPTRTAPTEVTEESTLNFE